MHTTLESASTVKKEIRAISDKDKAKELQRFFKTKKGEYGEGDKFLGVSVPDVRKIARKYKDLREIMPLLRSQYHEERLLALLILVERFSKGDRNIQKIVFEFYLKNTKFVNNWDLVDLTAHKIVGTYLIEKDKKILYDLAKSNNLWEKRIAIISCFAFIHKNDFKDAIKIAEILLHDEHDLIHKAVGWVLREVGKKDLVVEEKFLHRHYKNMPRTMLRYSIEKFPEKKRLAYLKGLI